MAECSNDGFESAEVSYTCMPQYCPNCAKSLAITEELRISNTNMKELQEKIKKLEYTCTKVRMRAYSNKKC